MAADPELTDSLAVEIISQLEQFHLDPRRVHDDPEALSVLQIIGSAVVYFEPPATVLDLLWHRDAASTVAVVVTTDLPKQRQSELPGLLARLETETRSAASDDRLTVVTIGDRQHLPRGGESSGVALATVWWWNRVARWDVAAHISQAGPPTGETRVLADVKTETIVEIARWNLDLAARMAKSWSGDPQDISNFLEAQDISTQTIDCTDRCGPRPPESNRAVGPPARRRLARQLLHFSSCPLLPAQADRPTSVGGAGPRIAAVDRGAPRDSLWARQKADGTTQTTVGARRPL